MTDAPSREVFMKLDEKNRRRVTAYRLRQAGLKWREVGERLGVSPSRAAQLAAVGEHIVNALGVRHC